jgi:hypothetical protein
MGVLSAAERMGCREGSLVVPVVRPPPLALQLLALQLLALQLLALQLGFTKYKQP